MMRPTRLEFPASAVPFVGRVTALRMLSWALAVAIVAVILALIFVPWQQTVRGQGRVIAYAPLDRQQALEAPIPGRVVHWYVQEGDMVESGAPVADISDNDPAILRRLRQEQAAAQAQVDAADLSIRLTEGSIEALETALQSAVENARLKVQIAHDRREAAQRAVDAAEAEYETASLNLQRQRALFEKGLASERDLELARLSEKKGETDLSRAKASLRAALSEARALTADQERIASYNRADIESKRSSLEKLKSDRAKAAQEFAKVQVRVARQERMRVVAPRAGTIFRLVGGQGGQMVKAGDPLAILVPEVGSQAVELYVDGNDAPLVQKGREVRVQFEGFPAVQFMGWPSVAVGSFPGKVAFVDAHDDGLGRFRIVVQPQKPGAWPDSRYLRQGARANGWVFLNSVPLGFELWRNFNGFPPALPEKGKSVHSEGKK